MKFRILAIMMSLLLLGGCAPKLLVPNNEVAENSATASALENDNSDVGKKSEEKVSGGIKLTVDATEDIESGELEKTVSYYMFEGDKLISVKNENTYETEDDAIKYEKQLKDTPDSCVDVTREGNVVTYYASKSALGLVIEMTKEDVKKLGADIGAEVEEF